MELNTLLGAAIQSSFLLGLLHGVNPCGHSWLVLAPFVSGGQSASRVALLTSMFVGGTVVACLLLGASLGAVSQIIPAAVGVWVEVITSAILIIVGLLLLYDPDILHRHEHDHDAHEHGHKREFKHHDHQHPPHSESNHHAHSHNHDHGILMRLKSLTRNKKLLPAALFGIGFINMIVPCPTAAVMYTYALNAGSVWNATVVFGTYAISTAITVGAVIFLIFKATTMAHSLQKDWVEPFIMRFAGIVIIVFSSYGIYHGLMA